MGSVTPYQLTANPYGFWGWLAMCFAAQRNNGSSMWNAFPVNGRSAATVSPARKSRRRARRPARKDSAGALPEAGGGVGAPGGPGRVAPPRSGVVGGRRFRFPTARRLVPAGKSRAHVEELRDGAEA